jgi:hypothetical protein
MEPCTSIDPVWHFRCVIEHQPIVDPLIQGMNNRRRLADRNALCEIHGLRFLQNLDQAYTEQFRQTQQSEVGC